MPTAPGLRRGDFSRPRRFHHAPKMDRRADGRLKSPLQGFPELWRHAFRCRRTCPPAGLGAGECRLTRSKPDRIAGAGFSWGRLQSPTEVPPRAQYGSAWGWATEVAPTGLPEIVARRISVPTDVSSGRVGGGGMSGYAGLTRPHRRCRVFVGATSVARGGAAMHPRRIGVGMSAWIDAQMGD